MLREIPTATDYSDIKQILKESSEFKLISTGDEKFEYRYHSPQIRYNNIWFHVTGVNSEGMSVNAFKSIGNCAEEIAYITNRHYDRNGWTSEKIKCFVDNPTFDKGKEFDKEIIQLINKYESKLEKFLPFNLKNMPYNISDAEKQKYFHAYRMIGNYEFVIDSVLKPAMNHRKRVENKIRDISDDLNRFIKSRIDSLKYRTDKYTVMERNECIDMVNDIEKLIDNAQNYLKGYSIKVRKSNFNTKPKNIKTSTKKSPVSKMVGNIKGLENSVKRIF